MIASHHDRSFELSLFDQLVHRKPELRTLAVAKPADSRWQSLKLDSLARQINPPAQNAVVRKQLEHQIICHMNVCRLARKRHPTERPPPFAKQRPYILRHKSRKVVRIFDSAVEGKRTNIVSVIKCD